MCQPASQKNRVYSRSLGHTYMRRSFNFSPIGERAEEEKALKSEVAEIKKILSDGSASELRSNGKFIVIFNVGRSPGSKNHHEKLCSCQ